MSLPFGVEAIVWTSPLNSLYALWTNMRPTKKHLDYSIKDQIRDLLPGILLAGAMAMLTWPISLLPINDFIVIALQVMVAIISYISLSKLFKVEAYEYCIVTVKGFIKAKNK